ncbi:hypothetical protein H6A33_09500 [Collinsella tanakaei]|nr:hypothetical protein [Collinsella tanakaei]
MTVMASASSSRQIQMNVRIDAALKEAGDTVLGNLGYTPSMAVRGFWRFIVNYQDDAAAVREINEPDVATELSAEAAHKMSATSRLRSLYEQTAAELGIDGEDASILPSWDELRDAWYTERLEGDA